MESQVLAEKHWAGRWEKRGRVNKFRKQGTAHHCSGSPNTSRREQSKLTARWLKSANVEMINWRRLAKVTNNMTGFMGEGGL